MIWKVQPNIDVLNEFARETLVGHLGIKVIEVGDDFVKASMPVDQRTKQPQGLLHGGASAALAESMGSFASALVVDDLLKTPVVGVELNINHLKAVKEGVVFATTRPIKIGSTIHVWNTEISNEKGELVAVSRLTVMVLKK